MSTPVVKIENLVKRYKELVALDHFNLEIEEGEIFGLLGPNGFRQDYDHQLPSFPAFL